MIDGPKRIKPYLLTELPVDLTVRMKLLAGIDTTVPERHEKGDFDRNDRAEIYTIINALLIDPHLPIPLPASVFHSDRPDIVVRSATSAIGIEIVEAVSQTTAAMDCERALLPDAPEFHWATKQLLGEGKKFAWEVRDMISNNEPGEGFIGDGAVDWAKAMANFVRRKMATVSKPGFQRFEKNWLLVYDNWREPARDLEKADIFLDGLLKEMTAFAIFDLILVLDDARLSVFRA
ncbi:hypothetical protein ACI2KS_23060 [Pseudomonas sp. NPDC087358]|uniref:hypothetical protein n=1 Tax=Pseudomonas sp. NPDC087358 TaxID=3364439 RepID=UPI00384D073C